MRNWIRILACLLFAAAAAATEIHHLELPRPGSAAIVIQETPSGEKKYILIDAGPLDRHDTVLNAVQKLEIPQIDLLIVTHGDTDHYCGYQSFLPPRPAPHASAATAGPPQPRGPPILEVLITSEIAQSKAYAEFLDALEYHEVDVTRADSAADVQRIEKAYNLRVIAPALPKMSTNDSSLQIFVRDSEVAGSHLFTGDITLKGWRNVKSRLPNTTVLSATLPHHGGERHSGAEVIAAIVDRLAPKKLVISANRQNQYHHPGLRVLRDAARRGQKENLRDVEELRRVARLEHGAYYAYLGDTKGAAHVLAAVDARYEALAAELVRRETVARRVRPTYARSDVLVTGSAGDITVRGRSMTPSRKQSAVAQFADAAVWYRLAWLTDSEVTDLRTWDHAEVYLRLQVAEDLDRLAAAERPEDVPVWRVDYERLLEQTTRHRVAPIPEVMTPRPATINDIFSSRPRGPVYDASTRAIFRDAVSELRSASGSRMGSGASHATKLYAANRSAREARQAEDRKKVDAAVSTADNDFGMRRFLARQHGGTGQKSFTMPDLALPHLRGSTELEQIQTRVTVPMPEYTFTQHVAPKIWRRDPELAIKLEGQRAAEARIMGVGSYEDLARKRRAEIEHRAREARSRRGRR